MNKIKTAIGLMSGTSMDGIDVALIKSDGKNIISRDKFIYYPYSTKTRNIIKKLINNNFSSLLEIKEAELEITKKHIEFTLQFIKEYNLSTKEIDIIGFHGHTILHDPDKKITWQIGNAQMLASETGINVVADFRIKDIVFGGNGAPLVPIYHKALFQDHYKPIIVLNIGGVSNLTYIENNNENDLIAFDVCFGNAPIDDLVFKKTGMHFDLDGKLSKKGKINLDLAHRFLTLDYFKKKAPKSLDRNQLYKSLEKIKKLKLENALATMCYIIAKALEISLKQLPKCPKEIIVCGGGRKNTTIMNLISDVTKIKTISVEEIINNGGGVEAEAFAFLAIRNLMELPISFKKTTGVLPEKHAAQPLKAEDFSSCGGVFYRA